MMEMIFHDDGKSKIAEIISEEIVINKTQDALDIMADADYNGARKIIIHEKNLIPDFFKLATGLAGEILQKFVNYKVQLALVGDFSKFKSKPLQDFIKECNKGSQIFFVSEVEKAIDILNSNSQ